MVNLKQNEKLALEKLLRELDLKFPKEISHTFLYGSKARGDSELDSDIDLLVILENDDSQIRRNILTLAAQISLEYDVLLNPIISTINRIERQRDFSFYKNVARDAVQLNIQKGELRLLGNISL